MESARQPQCPEEKEKAIVDALKYFGISSLSFSTMRSVVSTISRARLW